MDMLVTLVIFLYLVSGKVTKDKKNTVSSTMVNDDGSISVVEVVQSELSIGSNLYLKKEPRAYHKILDEMGLS